MEVIFLGTNGWYDTDTGNTVCTLVRTADRCIVLDAGNGIAKLDRYTDGSLPVHLFLSHFHLDHVAGLHVLAKFAFPRGLVICGPAGTKQTLDVLVNQPFTMPLQQLPYEVSVRELPEEAGTLPFPVTSAPMRHTGLTLGYRFELDGKVVAYCPDTGYCPEALALARGADLLIAECAYLPGEEQPDWPHLNPETAARIAKEAGAGRLALFHFDAHRYGSLAARADAEIKARKLFSDSFAAEDGLIVTV